MLNLTIEDCMRHGEDAGHFWVRLPELGGFMFRVVQTEKRAFVVPRYVNPKNKKITQYVWLDKVMARNFILYLHSLSLFAGYNFEQQNRAFGTGDYNNALPNTAYWVNVKAGKGNMLATGTVRLEREDGLGLTLASVRVMKNSHFRNDVRRAPYLQLPSTLTAKGVWSRDLKLAPRPRKIGDALRKHLVAEAEERVGPFEQ